MTKDSLEDISATTRESIIDGKIYKRKPITIGDWAELQVKLRTLLRKDAYAIDDLMVRYQELTRIDEKGIDRGDVRRSLGREEMAQLFFYKVFADNEEITFDNVLDETIKKLDAPEQFILMNSIFNDSVPQLESEGADPRNP